MGLKTPTGNWARVTPRRGPDFQHKTVKATSWGHISTPVRPNALRAKQRSTARRQTVMMHAMLTEIGVNPVYNNSYAGRVERNSPVERFWTKNAKTWFDANQKRYVEA